MDQAIGAYETAHAAMQDATKELGELRDFMALTISEYQEGKDNLENFKTQITALSEEVAKFSAKLRCISTDGKVDSAIQALASSMQLIQPRGDDVSASSHAAASAGGSVAEASVGVSSNVARAAGSVAGAGDGMNAPPGAGSETTHSRDEVVVLQRAREQRGIAMAEGLSHEEQPGKKGDTE